MAIVENWATIEKVILRQGVSRRIFTGKNSMMVLNEIAPGTTPPKMHSHPHEQLVYIMQGEGDFVLGTEVLPMKAGDLVVVPPNIPHTFKNTGLTVCLNLDVFSPIRDDYLPSQK